MFPTDIDLGETVERLEQAQAEQSSNIGRSFFI